MGLSDVERPAVPAAVGWMVADGLHAQHATFPNHDIGIRSPTLCSAGDLEGVSACLGAAAAAEVPRESAATLWISCSNNLTTEDPVVLSRSPPGMSTTVRTQRAMVATMGSGEGAELLREFVLDVGPAAWPPSIGIAMWLVSKVVGLSDVE